MLARVIIIGASNREKVLDAVVDTCETTGLVWKRGDESIYNSLFKGRIVSEDRVVGTGTAVIEEGFDNGWPRIVSRGVEAFAVMDCARALQVVKPFSEDNWL